MSQHTHDDGYMPPWGIATTVVFALTIFCLCCTIGVLARRIAQLEAKLQEYIAEYMPHSRHALLRPARPPGLPVRRSPTRIAVRPTIEPDVYRRPPTLPTTTLRVARSTTIPSDVRDIFHEFDRDRSGGIDTRELAKALNALGLQTSKKEATQVLAKYDIDHSGAIELDEFAELVADLRGFQSKGLPNGWEAIFDVEADRLYYWHAERGEAAWERPEERREATWERPRGRSLPPPPVKQVERTVTPTRRRVSVPQEVRDIFRSFDRDHSNDIDVRELTAALNALGLQTDLKDAAQVLSKYDSNHSGRIEIEEFAALVADLKSFQSRGLPAGWEAIYDADARRLYYWHAETAKTSWDKPGATSTADRQASPSRAGGSASPRRATAPSSTGSGATTSRTLAPITTSTYSKSARAVFNRYDRDGSGDIDFKELRGALRELFGEPIDGPQAAAILSKYDTDKSGRLEYDEFSKLVVEIEGFMKNKGRS